MTTIEQFIDKEVVTTSSAVIDFCIKELNISEVNARKHIQRLPEHIFKIKGICKNKQSILYKSNVSKNKVFYDALLSTLQCNAQQHYLVLHGLRLHHGVIPKEKLASFSSNPTEDSKGHKRFNRVIDDLRRLNLLSESDTHYYLENRLINETKAQSIDLIQSITLNHFHEWARNIGLISYNSAKFNDTFSRYQFGLVAPSYVYSLKSSNGDSVIPAFLVADVLLPNEGVREADVHFMIEKLKNISYQRQQARVIPFLLVSTHSKEVYDVLKKAGVVIGNVDELFGKSYSETLREIHNLLENAGVILRTNPDQYIKLIDNIEKLAIGKTNNLKGALFEMAVGLFHGQQCQSLDISKIVSVEGRKAEIDVFAVYQDRIVFAECKGCNSSIDDEYVEEWLSKKIPIIKQWALSCESYQNKKLEFEIWSTGGFSKDALERLRTHKEKTKRYSIDYFDMDKMHSIAREKNASSFQKILKEYYDKKL